MKRLSARSVDEPEIAKTGVAPLFFGMAIALIIMLFIGMVAGQALIQPLSSDHWSRVMSIAPPPGGIEAGGAPPDIQKSALLVQRWIAWAGLAMLLCNVVALALLFFTLRATRGLLVEAKLATSAATQTAATTAFLGERQMRAYLTAQKFELKFATATQPARIEVRIKNHGATPARSIEVRSTTRLQLADEPPPRDNLVKGLKGPMTYGALGARETYKIDWQLDDPSGEIVESILNGDLHIYWWGIIRFKDEFNRRRTQTFFAAIQGSPPLRRSNSSALFYRLDRRRRRPAAKD